MHPAAGQPPQQEAVDGAEGELATLGALPCARHVVEQPGDLGAGEVGVEQQAGALAHHVFCARSEEHTSELQSLMRISYAVFCLKKKKTKHTTLNNKPTSTDTK